MVFVQALLVGGFILVHLFAATLRFLEGIPRSRWLSMAGGVSVAYVFIHIFPDLQEAQTQIGEGWQFAPVIEHHAYLVALCGLAVFYGLERLVKSSQPRAERPSLGVFWLHIASFAAYNALIGYLLVHREERNLRELFFFFIAMGFHFLVNDYGLRHDHQAAYSKVGRWVLATAVLLGWLAGLATEVSRAITGVLFAFLAGGIVLNVMKEELPEERQSRFSAFALGAAAYAVLLLLL